MSRRTTPVEVTPSNRAAVTARLHAHRFGHHPDSDVTAMVRDVDHISVSAPDDVVVRHVRSTTDLRVWQQTSIATRGGMSTIPAHRRRGVQAAPTQRRLELASQRGCDVAATTSAAGGASERNLQRHGFVPAFTIETWYAPQR